MKELPVRKLSKKSLNRQVNRGFVILLAYNQYALTRHGALSIMTWYFNEYYGEICVLSVGRTN